MKSLRSGGFREAMFVWKPKMMDEISIREDKHIEAEEMYAGKKRKKQESCTTQPNVKNTISHNLSPEGETSEIRKQTDRLDRVRILPIPPQYKL